MKLHEISYPMVQTALLYLHAFKNESWNKMMDRGGGMVLRFLLDKFGGRVISRRSRPTNWPTDQPTDGHTLL